MSVQAETLPKPSGVARRSNRWTRRHGTQESSIDMERRSSDGNSAQAGFWEDSYEAQEVHSFVQGGMQDETVAIGAAEVSADLEDDSDPKCTSEVELEDDGLAEELVHGFAHGDMQEATVAIAAAEVSADLEDDSEPKCTSEVESEDDGLAEELELLRAMWPDEGELCIDYPPGARAHVTVQFEPHTAGESLEQFVRCELMIKIPKRYPHVPVQFAIISSRGLSAGQEAAILNGLVARAVELVGEPALYLLVETGKELLTAHNVPTGICAICLRELHAAFEKDTTEDVDLVEVVRTPCFHIFHANCLASYWISEWERQLQDTHSKSTSHICNVSVLCPECRTELLWGEMPQLQPVLEEAQRVASLQFEAKVTATTVQDSQGDLEVKSSEEQTADSGAATGQVLIPGRRQRRRQAKEASQRESGFLWSVEIQNSDTAYAGTSGTCSFRLVAEKGESDAVILNEGGGMKTGESVKAEVQVTSDLGDLVYVELRNTSAETWRPHWIKVLAPDGKESFIFSRQWVAKGRTQKAYAGVSGAWLPGKAASAKSLSAER